jgi:hypothetical protein
LALTLVLVDRTAHAGTVVGTSSGNVTGGGVKGSGWMDGSTVTISYANGVVVQATVNGVGGFYSPQPNTVPAGTKFTATGTEANGTPAAPTGKLAQLFTPPSNVVVTNFTVLPGSTLSFAGHTVPLVGKFTSVETGFQGNKGLPGFGNMSGSILAQGFSLGGPSLGLGFKPAGNIPFTINVAPVIQAAQSPNFVSKSVPVPTTPVSGLLTFNNQTFSASGQVTGTGTFFLGDQNVYHLDAILSSDLGPVSVSIDASAPSHLEAVPEPSTITLLGVATLGLLGCGWRRRKRAA